MRDLQILIIDDQGNQLGELDLTNTDDFALKLTKSIASINNLGRRNTSFSLDFSAPQTKNNNRLLNGVRFITSSKDILGKKACSILVDGNQIDRGFLYAFESEFEGDYKLVFKGLNNDWVERLQDVNLNQLNWRDYRPPHAKSEDATEIFDSARFAALNVQSSDNVIGDLIYPYVNRNNTGLTADFRPQIHIRSIILAMFEKIGYTIGQMPHLTDRWIDLNWISGTDSFGNPTITFEDAFNNDYLHLGLTIDPNFQLTRDEAEVTGQAVEYTVPATTGTAGTVGNIGTPTAETQVLVNRFPNLITTPIVDQGSNFDILNSEFVAPFGGTYEISFDFKKDGGLVGFDVVQYYDNYLNGWRGFASGNFAANPAPPSFKYSISVNNTGNTSINGSPVYVIQNPFVGDGQGNIQSKKFVFAQGDRVSIFLELNDDAGGRNRPFILGGSGYTYLNGAGIQGSTGSRKFWKVIMNAETKLTITPTADIAIGDEFRINSHIPTGIKCLSLLQDFKTMFNLYFDVDVNRKKVFIEPRDRFYSSAAAIDITEKIDLNTNPVLNYLTDYKNQLVFKYKDDSNDKYLEQWNKIYYKTYGQFKYFLGNNTRFDKGQSTLSTQLLSASIQGFLNGGESICTSIIKKEYLQADNGVTINDNYGFRVFQVIRGRQYTTSNTPRRTASPLSVTVAIMEEFANTPTVQDRKLTFDGERGLVWDYYRKTIANIEDTALLTLKINLSLYDFKSWDLSKTYFISEPAEIRGYYITDSIKNFNVTKETMTTITLVKFRDYIPVTIDGGSGNIDSIVPTPPEPQEIMCTVNGAIVACLDNNLQKMYKL